MDNNNVQNIVEDLNAVEAVAEECAAYDPAVGEKLRKKQKRLLCTAIVLLVVMAVGFYFYACFAIVLYDAALSTELAEEAKNEISASFGRGLGIAICLVLMLIIGAPDAVVAIVGIIVSSCLSRISDGRMHKAARIFTVVFSVALAIVVGSFAVTYFLIQSGALAA